jgi:ectoine hydroxylase-related dioxygenase (phytanoyl-CoA dioxygenase family)
MFDAVNKGSRIPDHLLGELPDRSHLLPSFGELRRHLDEDGYLLLRDVLPGDDILAARREVTSRLAEMGEIKEPAAEAIVTGTSQRLEKVADAGAFWKSVSEGPKLRRVSHGSAVQNILAGLLSGPVVGHDLVYLRVAAPGRALDLHYDYPFFARGTKDLYTCWIPLGEVPVTDGPLFVIEGSNRYAALISDLDQIDQRQPPKRKLAYDKPAIEFAEEHKTRILTADFRPGDVIIFSLFTAHGSLDNCSPINRARISCDLRYQRADAPRDERFFGPSPAGVSGNGYADLNGAKPLTASWKTN